METLGEFLVMVFVFGVLGFFAMILCGFVLIIFIEDIVGIDVKDLIKRWLK